MPGVWQKRGVMRRKLFTLFSAISLALCVAACVMWVWSYDRYWSVGYPNSHADIPTGPFPGLDSYKGLFVVQPPRTRWYLRAPYWWITLVLIVLPLLWMRD